MPRSCPCLHVEAYLATTSPPTDVEAAVSSGLLCLARGQSVPRTGVMHGASSDSGPAESPSQCLPMGHGQEGV